MSKRRLTIVLLLTFVALLALLTARFLWPRGPSYGGLSLNDWVRCLDGGHHQKSPDEAGDAIRHIGTNAVPFLLSELQRENPTFEETLRATWSLKAGRQAYMERLKRERESSADSATRAFMRLGPAAECAFPEFIRLLSDPRRDEPAARSAQILEALGAPALGPLLSVATNGTGVRRLFALEALGRIGPNAAPAIPLLTNFIEHQELSMASAAVVALGRIGAEPHVVVPLLIKAFQGPRPMMRYYTAFSLSCFGYEARSAVPSLQQALQDPDPNIRRVVTEALRKIAPEALTNAPPR